MIRTTSDLFLAAQSEDVRRMVVVEYAYIPHSDAA